MMEREKKHDYEVGWGKPPLHARFQKGRSGNPNGRPRGARNTAVLLKEELQEPVRLPKTGKTLTMRHVIIRQQVTKAARGDLKASRFVLLELPQPRADEFAPHRRGGLSAAAERKIRAALTGIPWKEV
jgi:hypothetical protein